MIRHLLLYSLILICLFAGTCYGHEMRPAFLQVNQVSETEFQVIWKVPRRGDMVIRLRPVFPEADLLEPERLPQPAEGAMLYTYRLESQKALAGQPISIEGLERTMIDVLVQVNYLESGSSTLLLKPDENAGIIPGDDSGWRVVQNYTILGIEHIWFGIDHLLFVLALIIITRGIKKVIKTITAFTIAHSITLSLAALGFVSVPGPPVEAVIALSIVFLAMEIIKNQRGEQTLTGKKPWLVAFTFGLLHGLGFAGALAEIGLPQNEIPLALAFFNIGVELGQIAFVMVVAAILWVLRKKQNWPGVWQKVPGYAIGSVAAFWMIERIVGFWS